MSMVWFNKHHKSNKGFVTYQVINEKWRKTYRNFCLHKTQFIRIITSFHKPGGLVDEVSKTFETKK